MIPAQYTELLPLSYPIIDIACPCREMEHVIVLLFRCVYLKPSLIYLTLQGPTPYISLRVICMKTLLHLVWIFFILFVLFLLYPIPFSHSTIVNSRQMIFCLMHGVPCALCSS